MSEPKYDTSNFVNDGPFFDAHPDVYPFVRRYERVDGSGEIIESWERNKSGVMIDVTQRDKLYAEIVKAQDNIESIRKKEVRENA